MKPAPLVLVNLAVVVLALVVYDQIRGEGSPPSSSRATSQRSGVSDEIDIERRLRALEAKLAALPEEKNWDAAVMRELEKARAAPATKPDVPSDATDAAPIRDERTAAPAPTGEPTEADLARFRKLRRAVQREDTIQKNRDRIDRRLDKSGVLLTPEQRENVHHAWAEFQPRVTAIWSGIKADAETVMAAGGQIDGKALREQGSAQIQSELAAALADTVNHQADAEAVATALTARGGK